jgi:hypothetical protein
VPTRTRRKRLAILPIGKYAAFSPDGQTLAIGCSVFIPGQYIAHVQLWDPVVGELRASFQAHQQFIGGLAFDRTGRFLATAGAGSEATVKIWPGAGPAAIGPP